MNLRIRQIKESDIEHVTNLYNWYILNTTITFEVEAIATSEMAKRVNEKLGKYDWLVGELDHVILGYAYYGAFHARSAYGHTVESTIYLSPEHTGKGIGTSLYDALINSAKDRGYRELIGLIALPNAGSTTLHKKFGFEQIGVLKRVGYKFDRYIDVSFWQKSLA